MVLNEIAQALFGETEGSKAAKRQAAVAQANLEHAEADNRRLERDLRIQREQARQKETEHKAQLRDTRNRADQEIQRNTDQMNGLLKQQEDRFDKRERQQQETAEENRRMAQEELNRNIEEGKSRSREQAAMFNKRENQLTTQIEDTKKTAENEKNAMKEQFQKETETLMEQNRNDEVFNRQNLEGNFEHNKSELEDMQRAYKEASEKMLNSVDARNKEIQDVRQRTLDFYTKHEEQRRNLLQLQAARAEARGKQYLSEVTGARDSSEKEKQSIMDASGKRREELDKQLKSDLKKTWKERENDIKQRDKAVQREVEYKKMVDERREADKANHRKEMKEMMVQYKEETKALYDKLYAENEKFKLEEIGRIADETKARLRIVDRDFQIVRKDAIVTVYQNLGHEFNCLQSRAQVIAKIIHELIEYIEPEKDGFTFELLYIHGEYQSEAALFERQLDKMRFKMNMNRNVTDGFKQALLAPLEDYENSYKHVENVKGKMLKASKEKSMKELGPMKESLSSHVGVVRDTVRKMRNLDLKSYVESTLAEVVQKAIEN